MPVWYLFMRLFLCWTLHLILILPIWRYTFIINPERRIHCRVLGADPHQNKCTVINTVVLEHDYRSPWSNQLGLQEVGYSINKGLSQSTDYLAGPGTECVEQWLGEWVGTLQWVDLLSFRCLQHERRRPGILAKWIMSNATQCQEFQASQRKYSLTEAHQRLAAWLAIWYIQTVRIYTDKVHESKTWGIILKTELAQPVATWNGLWHSYNSCY